MRDALVRYIRYVRKQSKQTKETHAAILSALITLGIVFIYVLTMVYGQDTGGDSPAVEMPSPFQMAKEGVSSIFKKVKIDNTYSVENP